MQYIDLEYVVCSFRMPHLDAVLDPVAKEAVKEVCHEVC